MIELIEKASARKDEDFFCTTRDVFQARLDSYVMQTNRYLLSAVIGEIGNNTFDHNWNYSEGHARGAYFNVKDDYVILADFGRGLRSSLKKAKDCSTDLDAIKVAFTERISGRSPEQRGNGLKFVCDSVKQKGWSLYFQSGNAACTIENGIVQFSEKDFSFTGCLALLEAKEERNEC
ncbi:MAG: hypothetical protein IJU95_03220 [Treponema sp.]|nr:hypothetical protein [Treponema sp.]